MSNEDFLMEESVKNYKKFNKSRKFINGVTTAGILAGSTLAGVLVPLSFTSAPVALIAGGVIGAAVGGVASFVKQKKFDYIMGKDASDTLRSVAEAEKAKSLRQIANKVSSPQEVNKNQVKVSSPQDVNENVEKGNGIVR